MSVSRHLINLLTFDSPIFFKEAARTSLVKSNGAMNFLFIRIYKSANIDYLDSKQEDHYKLHSKIMMNNYLSFRSSASYILYILKKEKFTQFLREVFMHKSVFNEISNYFKWRQSYDAGLTTACLISFNSNELNHYCGKSLSQPIIHKYGVLDKICHISEMPFTHTSWVDEDSSVSSDSKSERDPFGYRKNSDDSESENEYCSRLARSVSVPNLEKLELSLSKSKLTKSMYSKKESTAETDLKFNGKTIDYTHSDFFSFSSRSSVMF